MKNTTYLTSFQTEQEALEYCNCIIGGGIVQKQGDLWHVWQINS
jgi:hypothetical protein